MPIDTFDPDRGRTYFVLGGGGALGAYQAGALLALAEGGIVPDAMFACSVGALNAAFLASEPGIRRATELTAWWSDPRTHGVLAPSVWGRAVGFAAAVVAGRRGVFDDRPLRRLIAANVLAHDIAELAVPVTVTTTCLDCGEPVHHGRGAPGDVLVASCALPGLFAPVRLADGHRHVDGGVLCGVPIGPALAAAGPQDRVFVLDCGLAPVTGRPGRCASIPVDHAAQQEACGLGSAIPGRSYQPPVELHRGAVQVVLDAFTVARAAANQASLGATLDDPRVHVLPHVADAWASGRLKTLPSGPRDCSIAGELLQAGQTATASWLLARGGLGSALAEDHGGRGQHDLT